MSCHREIQEEKQLDMNLDVKCFLMLLYTAVPVCSVAIRLSEMCVCGRERELTLLEQPDLYLNSWRGAFYPHSVCVFLLAFSRHDYK